MNNYQIKEENLRLDLYLTKLLNYSRSQVKTLFTNKFVFINGELAKPSYLIKVGDNLTINELLKEKEVKPKNLNLEIVFEDSELLIINKPKGLLTHGALSSDEDSVVNHLLHYYPKITEVGDKERPGIVHRLDKNTSGLLISAKTNTTYTFLQEQFKDRLIDKEYLAIVHGNFKEEKGTINAPIMRDPITKVKMIVSSLGKESLTHFEVLNQVDNYSYLKLDLITGRTHQIRVHLEFINHPLIGDETYGVKDDFKDSFYLHAKGLVFNHPLTNELLTISVNPPKEFTQVYNSIFK